MIRNGFSGGDEGFFFRVVVFSFAVIFIYKSVESVSRIFLSLCSFGEGWLGYFGFLVLLFMVERYLVVLRICVIAFLFFE